jgi:alginate O-acetyltransferase complex protein AlgI
VAFNSIQYILFFTAVLCVYFTLPQRFRVIWLVAASLFFYAAADPLLLIHLLVVTSAVYFLALKIHRTTVQPDRKRWMVGTIVLLVINLVAFKYLLFLSDSLRSLCAAVGIPYPVPVFRVVLPIGISFYTFSLISYVADVYKGMEAETRFKIFALYVSFFPKIIAGPIERARALIPQFDTQQSFDYERACLGLQLILWGAFKKVVVADTIAPFVSRVYDNPQAADGVGIAVATVLYAFQLYCDFSGYTDIAIGSALILGFKLTANFNRPYIATSIQDYWKRWHMSLTSWLTDYVYTPMSRSTLIKIKWYNLMLLSLFITFVVSGLWHGAQWTFVVWGALHGSYIVLSQLTQKPRGKTIKLLGLNKSPRALRSLRIGWTFTLICLAYIVFRSNSLADAGHFFLSLHTGWLQPQAGLKALIDGNRAQLLICLAGIAIVLLVESLQTAEKARLLASTTRWQLNYAMTAAIVLLGALYQVDPQFIYFRF